MSEKRRSLELEQTVDASPEEAWEALTTAAGLERWFPLEARVEPGKGGTIWLSWGPGCEGEAPIHAWDPPHRFGWTEQHGTDENGRPIEVAVDFHVEGRSGSTLVRVVQSGFGASSDWDEMYDAVRDGWTYFLFNLAFYFREHRGKERHMVWRRQPTALPREEAWSRLVAAGLVEASDARGEEPSSDESGPIERSRSADAPASVRLGDRHPARVATVRTGHHFAAVLPDLGDALWFVEVEGRHVGFWLSVYDTAGPELEGLQRELDACVVAALANDA